MSTSLINKFYTSFQKKDFKSMQACYHPEIEFSDNVFLWLKGNKAKAMWHMLLTAGADPKEPVVTFGDVEANESKGSCHWEAVYTFSLTGRKVHNKIEAQFIFKDGLIIRHIDTFPFWRWTRMAFGLTGTLMGWSSFFKGKIRKGIGERLEKFIAGNPEYL